MEFESLSLDSIKKLWESKLGATNPWFNDIIMDYAPPLSMESIRLIQNWTNNNKLQSLIQTLDLEPNKQRLPKAILTKYPLFGAHLSISDYPCSQIARNFLIEHLGGNAIHFDQDFIPEVYYHDCLVFRKFLKHILLITQSDSDFQDVLNQVLQKKIVISDSSLSDFSRFERLINGERFPGVRKNIRTTPYNEESIRRIPQVTKIIQESHKFGLITEPHPLEDDNSSGSMGDYHPTVKNSDVKYENDDDSLDNILVYRRKIADMRTPADDKRLLSKLPWLQSIRECRSEADIHRLPLSHLCESINRLYQQNKINQWAFAWILATTGVPVQRLAQLEVVQSGIDSFINENSIFFNLSLGELQVHLIDGASGFVGASNRVLKIPLPASIAYTIESLNEPRPFVQTPGNVDHTLRRHFQKVPGLTPTCQRIRATAEAIIAGLAHDNTAALSLKGQYGYSSRGAAAYRVLSNHELHTLHTSAFELLRSQASQSNRYCPDAFPIHNAIATHALDFIGSTKAVDPKKFKSVFQFLEHEIETLISKTHHEKGYKGVRIETLIDLQNAHARLTYLAFMLSTGARIISNRSIIKLCGHSLYIQDKDSARLSERRTIPALPSVIKQLNDQRLFTENLIKNPQFAHSKIIPSLDATHLTLWVDRLDNTIKVRKMRQSDFAEITTRFNLNLRATRHTFINSMRTQLPETELNSAVGHSGGGFHRESTTSMATDQFSSSFLTVLQDFMNAAGFHPLNPEPRYAK